MCRHGSTFPVNVPIPTDLSHTRELRWAVKPVDSCIARIIGALNEGGVFTRASCCGHGRGPGTIELQDGRTLVVVSHQVEELEDPEELARGD